MIWLEHTFWFIKAGGPVMGPLILVSIWMWFLIAWKTAWLRRVRRGRISTRESLDLLGSSNPVPGPRDDPRRRALDFFIKTRTHSREPDQLLWTAAVQRQRPFIQTTMTTILVLAAAAPLLGLLGTVTGMVNTFDVIGRFGTSKAQALATGIEEALITTQAGLMVAIPGLLAGQALNRRVKHLAQDLTAFHRTVQRFLEKNDDQTTR